jgi:HSP20 family molecular chaperone IbpA
MLVPSIFSNRFFDDFFQDAFQPFSGRYSTADDAHGMMNVDVKEYDDKYLMDLELPGYQKEDVHAQLKDGYLIIQAERSESNDEKDEKGHYIRKERFSGKCQRSFYVGKQVTESDIAASFKDGILSLQIPKVQAVPEQDSTRYISIN